MDNTSWNTQVGALRAALTQRDWRQAGALVWSLRQQDQARYIMELEPYVTQHCKTGGYPVALDTQQRLEAIREAVRDLMELLTDTDYVRAHRINLNYVLLNLLELSHGEITYSLDSYTRRYLVAYIPGLLHENPRMTDAHPVRPDVQDVIWTVLQEYPEMLRRAYQPRDQGPARFLGDPEEDEDEEEDGF